MGHTIVNGYDQVPTTAAPPTATAPLLQRRLLLLRPCCSAACCYCAPATAPPAATAPLLQRYLPLLFTQPKSSNKNEPMMLEVTDTAVQHTLSTSEFMVAVVDQLLPPPLRWRLAWQVGARVTVTTQ